MSSRDQIMAAAGDGSPRLLSVEIDTGDTPWTALGDLDLEAAVGDIAAALMACVKLPAARATATLVLGTDAEIRALNRSWRAQDKPTNVLSFPSPPPPRGHAAAEFFLGDVIVAEETLAREAAEQGIAPADHFRHLVLHGLLHLLGYDHESDAEAEEMEALETRILVSIGVRDPYAGTEPVGTRSASANTTDRA